MLLSFFFFCISQDRMIENDQTKEWKSLSKWNFLYQNLLKQHGQVLFFLMVKLAL